MTKIKAITFIGLSALSLVACGVDNTGKEANETSSATIVESQSSEASSEEKDENLVTNGPLLKSGQYSIDDVYGRIELEKIASPGNELEVAPGVFVTFGDVKILKFADIPESAREDASIYYGFDSNIGYDLQFEYTVENRNDFKIENVPVEKVILSDGEQVDRHMYGDETYELESGSKASNQVGHISIPHSDISSVKFYINPMNYDTYDSLESQPVEIVFE